MLTETHVILAFVLAVLGCVMYIITRYRRQARLIWGLMIIPCTEIILTYLWFSLGDVEIAARAQPFRLVLISIALQIASISVSLSIRDWRNVRK